MTNSLRGLNKIPLGKKNRTAKIEWLRTYIKNEERYVRMRPFSREFKVIVYVYLTDEELVVYKLKFGE